MVVMQLYYNYYLNKMETKFTGSNYYKRSFTEYEVKANERDAAKNEQRCNECSLTEDEVNAYERDQFYAAVAAKNEHDYKLRRAELDAEIPALEAEIAAAKTKHADALAVKDAEIIALMAEIAAAKTKRNNKLAAMDAEIAALEAELAASKTKPNALET